MRKLLMFALAFLFTMSFGLSAYAWTNKSDHSSKKDVRSTRSSDVRSGSLADLKASDIIGAKVENRQGDNLGTIKDLAVDPKTNRIDFVVLSEGGALGVGSDYVAIPLRFLSVRAKEHGKIDAFVLNMSKERLAQAPKFNMDRWPDRAQVESSYRYFGQQPSWSDRGVNHREERK